MAKQNKKKQERKLAAREKHKNNSKSQENDSTDDPDLEKQLDRINLKLSYGFHNWQFINSLGLFPRTCLSLMIRRARTTLYQKILFKTKCRDVNGDGNCLFRAIADQMTGKESNHRKFRRDAVDYVKNNKDDFAPFIEDDWDNFLSTLGQDLGHIQ